MSNGARKTLAVLSRTEIAVPPFMTEGRVEAVALLTRLQDGETLTMPQSKPMPSIGPRVHELRIRDNGHNWRIIYRIDPDELLVVEVFAKTTPKTPKKVIELCRKRLKAYDAN